MYIYKQLLAKENMMKYTLTIILTIAWLLCLIMIGLSVINLNPLYALFSLTFLFVLTYELNKEMETL